MDDQLRFTDVWIGWPGSVGDSRIWSMSRIGQNYQGWLEKWQRIEVVTKERENGLVKEKIPFFILADSAYANGKHLVTTFENRKIAEGRTYQVLNAKLAAMRNRVENKFGILKQQWLVLSRPSRIAIQDVKKYVAVIGAVCLLENFVTMHQESVELSVKQMERYLQNLRLYPILNLGHTPEDRIDVEERKTRDKLYDWMQWVLDNRDDI